MSSILKAYLKNKTSLKRYLYRFCASSEDVEDIAQEAFMKAFAAENAHPILFPRAFLFRTAKNLALNLQEKKRNRSTDSLEDIDAAAVIDKDAVGGETEVEARECVRLLMQAVTELPPQCARAFLLRKVEGYTYKQIAERMNISVSTAEKHVALGLLRCSDYLRRHGYEVGASAVRSGQQGSPMPVVRLENRRKD